MKRVLLSLLVLVLLISCQDQDVIQSQQELRQIEYTRHIDQQKIIHWLNHKNPEIRKAAVKTLGRIQDTTTVILIANRLTDDDPGVRAEAVFALGQFFNPRVESYLIDALRSESNKPVRVRVVEALGKSGATQNLILLRDFIESADPEYQKAAAIASGILAYRGQIAHTLAPSLENLMVNSPDPEVAWRAAYAVYRIGVIPSFDNLVLALDRPEPLVKFFAVKGLNRMVALIKAPQFNQFRNNPQAKALLKTYNSRGFRRKLTVQLQDSTWYVRVAALELLDNLEDHFLQPDIIKALDDPHPYVQIQAIRTLAKYKNWQTRKEMKRLINKSPDWRIQGEALTVLAQLEPKAALKLVKEEVLDKPWPQNYYAIKTLENIDADSKGRPLRESREATELLMKLADSDNIAQTTLTMEVLVNRNQPPSVEYLIGKLKTGDMALATIISTYLAVADPRPAQAVAPLIEVYKQFSAPRDLEAMEPIITALDSIGSLEAVPFLKEQLKNPYPGIREKARAALEHITGKTDFPTYPPQEAYTTKWDFPPVSPDTLYQVTVSTTVGDFTIELYPEKAPVNAAKFVKLVKDGFYDGIYFHRVVPGFVIQVGDPRGDGWGGPGYAVPCEYNDLSFDRGVVGIAHAGKDTGSSQFFVVHTPQPHLNGRYTAFGKVVKGMDVVDRIMMFDRITGTQLTKVAR